MKLAQFNLKIFDSGLNRKIYELYKGTKLSDSSFCVIFYYFILFVCVCVHGVYINVEIVRDARARMHLLT